MKIKVWGCRGSLATCGPAFLRHGGNTTCLEIRGTDGEVIVVDAGSGARNLGKALLKEPNLKRITCIFTHAHWDHLAGFPFFAPIYHRRFTINLCGGPKAQKLLRKYLTRQMAAPFFPVDFSFLKARFHVGCDTRTARCDGSIHGYHGKLRCHPIPLNHPNGGYGFKFVDQGRTLVFIPDNELRYHHPGGPRREEFVKFCQDADLLLYDAQFTDQQYKFTRGWGHSTYTDAADLAIAANVKRLGLFHHDPDRTDAELARHLEYCRRRIRNAGSRVKCFACAEGMVLKI